jgi:hypothetical protein
VRVRESAARREHSRGRHATGLARFIAALSLFVRVPTEAEARRVLNDFPELAEHGPAVIDQLIRGNLPSPFQGLSDREAHARLRERRALLIRQQRQSERRSRSSDHRGVISLIFILIFAAAITAGILIYNKTKTHVPKALIPQITRVTTYRKGSLVYVRVHYGDPHHYATGFGFVGINGAGWAEENHSFADPSYGIPGPDRIDYPFNLGCGTSSQSQSDVQVWITDVAGDHSRPVNVHLTCKRWTRVR